MAFPRNSLRNFLVHAKKALRTAISNNDKVTFAIGNESADLDSLTCSLLFAYLRSQQPPKHAFTPLYIPVTNIPANDIHLRPEFLALLPHANLEPSHLITLDDLAPLDKLDQKLSPKKTRWILVDHNALQGVLGHVYGDRVAGCIDHHDDENKVPKDTADEPRVIEVSGSCTSLVTEYMRPFWDHLSSEGLSSGAAHGQSDGNVVVNDAYQINLWDAQVAKLALASVLIDTSNLRSTTKTTDHDVKAVKYLEAKITLQDSKFDKDKLFAEISHAKQDIGGMRLYDILRKDYKQWDDDGFQLGISSCVKPVEFLRSKVKEERGDEHLFWQALGRYTGDRGVELYSIMTSYSDENGEHQRQLLLWALSEKGKRAAETFAESAAEELGLEELVGEWVAADVGWKKVWRQKNLGASRKQVAPLLRKTVQ
ncbi:uncharacterized protein J3D65DRAFT_46514 [Phyllosticta citribraziliensis]|uniref:DHHA2 domain-containing protein n=1 Tax=Phyllosticta citribraziliensis TaxID=989973 RepID=A0ABR1MCP1_9PEZI